MVTKLWARAREVIVLAPKRTLIVVAVLVGVVILYVLGSDKQRQGGTNNANAPAASSSACRVAVTADILNVRQAPDAKAQIVGKFQRNAEADAEKLVQNGFRKLSENRWVSNDYIKPLQGRDC
ncbi:hypothetical protein ALI144C_11875 [Actinosynnema sp. ALI-1.44]|uniref:SH3 domain-containing protein n=1 Tax=Actinosynnema sp. ALI-1.44 TaxID=1933779 RepID=UPI00097C509B|nr:SH3 domain-containing protein [Actinosynnema sp. ALI-1.44]ONI85811.1 hypothetical protein ALI144C_11875 [Actinosynnema sp. ALI-1.44]